EWVVTRRVLHNARDARLRRREWGPARRRARSVPDRGGGRRVGTPRGVLLPLRAPLVGEQAFRDRRVVRRRPRRRRVLRATPPRLAAERPEIHPLAAAAEERP